MKIKNKNIYGLLVIGSFIGILIFVVFGVSQILSYLNSGADRSSMLHVELNKEEVYLPKVIWKDTTNPGRSMEKQTLLDIEKDYLNAWYVRHVAYQTNLINGIDEYYTTSARQHIVANIDTNRKNNVSVIGTTTDHNLSLNFYSTDGQLVGLRVTNVREYQSVYKDGKLLLETVEESDYQMLLLLEDGFWRIRHLIKEENQADKKGFIAKGNTQVIGNKIHTGGIEYRIKGINYYPQHTPWDMFGDDFEMSTISKDFDIIKDMKLNTIRIFVSYEDFGKANVKQEKLVKLKQVLDKAADKNLKVIVTLFDFYGDYSVLDWTLTHRHVEQIVTEFKSHPAILAWDIKNEPNLDFKTRGQEKVVAWLREIIHQIKKYDPYHLVTIGWSDIESARLLQNDVDIVSFHYYKNIDAFEEVYQELDDETDKPIILQEYGISSNRGLWNPLGASEGKQADYYKQFQEIVTKNSIHYMFWTLYDFEKIPNSVVGTLPWRKQKQKYFGCIDREGAKKESFEFIEE